MQEFRRILEDETLANSLEPMNRNWESMLSQHSGTVFPTKNVVLGQPCFRTNELCLYICANVEKALWVKIADLKLTYINKEYVDSMHIDYTRVDNLIDNSTQKIKMGLLNTGTTAGKLITAGSGDKIATSLIDTGTTAGKILQVNANGKIPNGVLNIGTGAEQIPILDSNGKLPQTFLPTNAAVFDSQGRLKFPNGSLLWVG